nr:unnamed protein product [Digitaria exilis]
MGGFSGMKHTPQSRALVSSTVASPAAAAALPGRIRDAGIAASEEPDALLFMWTPALARVVVAFFTAVSRIFSRRSSPARKDSPARSLTMDRRLFGPVTPVLRTDSGAKQQAASQPKRGSVETTTSPLYA